MKKNIVAIGGGTGMFTLLRGLKKLEGVDISAIVTMMDSGGSAGRLRDEFGFLPVGDIRQCIVALAEDTSDLSLLRSLFLYRFSKGAEGLMGHSLGNLVLIALTDILGSEVEAIKQISKVFRLKGRVIPVTTQNTNLVASYQDGTVIKGEKNIDEVPREDRRIDKVFLEPISSVNEDASFYLEKADIVILGPGDLYTSIIPNLLVKGVIESIKTGKIAYVMNLFSKFGQTYKLDAKEHLNIIERYISPLKVSNVIVNTSKIPSSEVLFYEKFKELPVIDDLYGDERVVRGDFLSKRRIEKQKGDVLQRSVIRHDSDKLAEAIYSLL